MPKKGMEGSSGTRRSKPGTVNGLENIQALIDAQNTEPKEPAKFISEDINEPASETVIQIPETIVTPAKRRSRVENHGDSILDRGIDETRREYYTRVKTQLHDEVRQLEEAGSRTPEEEADLLAKKEKLQATEDRERTGRKKATTSKNKKAAEVSASEKEKLADERLTARFASHTEQQNKNEFDALYENAADEHLPKSEEDDKSISSISSSIEAPENPRDHGLLKTEAQSSVQAIPTEEKKLNRSVIYEKHKAKLDAIEAAQTVYFDALKEHQKKRGSLGIATEKFLGEKLPKDVKALWQTWIDARSDLWHSQAEIAQERLANHPATRGEVLEGLEKYKGKFTQEQIMARHERWNMARTTLIGREKAEDDIRIAGLNERDKGRFDKALEWYKDLPPGVRIVGTSAIITGAVAGGTFIVLGSTTVGIASMLYGGSSAAARWYAEAKKDTNPKTSRLIKTLASIPAVAGWLAQQASDLEHKLSKTEAKADAYLAKDSGFGNLHTKDSFEKEARKQRQAVTAKEGVERDGRISRTLGAMLGGFGFAHAVHDMFGGHSNHDTHTTDGSDTTSGSTSSTTSTESITSPIPKAHPHSILNGTASKPEGSGLHVKEESLSIHGRVNDADRLMGHFRDQLTKEYGGDLSKAPPAIRTFIEHKGTQDELTKWFGLQGKDGTSAMMHEGDTIKIDSDGELMLVTKGGQSHVLIDAQGKMHEFDLTKFHTTPNPHAAGAHHAAGHVSAEHAPASTNTHTELDQTMADVHPENTDQLAGTTATESVATDTGTATPEPVPSPAHVTGSTGGMESAQSFVENQNGATARAESYGAAALGATGIHTSPGEGMEPANSWLENGTPAVDHALNTHGIAVIPSEPHSYLWKTPEGKNIPIEYGGSAQEASAAAREYVNQHPNSTMYFITEKKNFFGTVTDRFVSSWHSNASGAAELLDRVSVGSKSMTLPNTDDFTQIIS
jgi:hypothetical protein